MLNLGASHNLPGRQNSGTSPRIGRACAPCSVGPPACVSARCSGVSLVEWVDGGGHRRPGHGGQIFSSFAAPPPPRALKSAPRRLSRRLTRRAARPLNTDIMTLFVMTDDCSYTGSCMAAAAAVAASLNKVLPRLRLIPRRFHLIRPLAFLPLPRRMLFCLVLGKLLVSTVLN